VETTPGVVSSCSLGALEKTVLGFHRIDDVSGFEIPERYFHYLRTGEAALLEGVLEHNRLDLISTAALMSHALGLVRDGPEACSDEGEQLALGRLYERAGDRERATRAFELAARAGAGDRVVRRRALASLAAMMRRDARYDEAADAWHEVLALAEPEAGGVSLGALERQAAEALAVHLEHRAHDLAAARRYAQALRTAATGRARVDADHRLGRIDRKLNAATPVPGLVTLNWEADG